MKNLLSTIILLLTLGFTYSQVTETFDGVTISGGSFTTNSGLSFTTSDTFESYGTDLQNGGVTLTAPIPHVYLDQSGSYFEFTPTSADKLLSSLSFDLWYSNSNNSETTLACECKSYDSSGNLLETITKDVIAKAYTFSGTPKKVRCNITEINPDNAVFFDDLTFTLVDESSTSESVPFSFNSTNPLGIESTFSNNSTGNYSFSVGIANTASGEHSSAFGQEANATGLSSLASGYDTTASGAYSSAFGQSTTASGSHSSAFGNLSTATAFTSFSAGSDSHANGAASIALGSGANAQNDYAVAIGHGATTSAESSVALGYNVTASAVAATAMGYRSIASGDYSVAIGYGSLEEGNFSTGTPYYRNEAIGIRSHVIGNRNKSTGSKSFSIGNDNLSLGTGAFSIGENNISTGDYSMALGLFSESVAYGSFSFGNNAYADGYNTTAIGSANTVDDSAIADQWNQNNRAFVIGNGFYDIDNAQLTRSDAFTVWFNGDATLAGNLNINSDARLKANIVSLGATLSKLLQIDGKSYTMKKDESKKQKIGLLAQDIEKVFPELVSESNGIKSVNYQGLVPVLINALKQQDVLIKEQQRILSKQQSEVDELKSMMQKIIEKL